MPSVSFRRVLTTEINNLHIFWRSGFMRNRFSFLYQWIAIFIHSRLLNFQIVIFSLYNSKIWHYQVAKYCNPEARALQFENLIWKFNYWVKKYRNPKARALQFENLTSLSGEISLSTGSRWIEPICNSVHVFWQFEH